jgi:hypothetical protein
MAKWLRSARPRFSPDAARATKNNGDAYVTLKAGLAPISLAMNAARSAVLAKSTMSCAGFISAAASSAHRCR